MIDSKPYLCRHCESLIGRSTETVLTIGGVEFKRMVSFNCRHCRKYLTWSPVKKENIITTPVLVSTAA